MRMTDTRLRLAITGGRFRRRAEEMRMIADGDVFFMEGIIHEPS